MNSSAYAGIFAGKAETTVHILDGVGHLDIVSNDKAINHTLSWMAGH